MWLEEIQIRSDVFVDANIFLYNILRVNKWFNSCNRFLRRIENGDFKAFTSPIVIGEVMHKLMVSETVKEYGKKPFEVVNFLKNNPEKVKAMVTYNDIIENIEDLPIIIVDISRSSIILAKDFIEEYGFLTNDALHLAVMKQNNLTDLVSNDSDFERVPWVKLYKPSKSIGTT